MKRWTILPAADVSCTLAGASASGMRPAARSGSNSAPPTSPARIRARFLRFNESCCWRVRAPLNAADPGPGPWQTDRALPWLASSLGFLKFVRKRELCCVSGRSLWKVFLGFCFERLADKVDKTHLGWNAAAVRPRGIWITAPRYVSPALFSHLRLFLNVHFYAQREWLPPSFSSCNLCDSTGS